MSDWPSAVVRMRAIITDRRLEAAAGEPLVQRTTAGTTTGLSIEPLEGRTIYAVVDVIGTADGWTYPISHGTESTTEGGIQLRTAGAGTNSFSARFDMANGSPNRGVNIPNRIVGKHVLWGLVNDGMTQASAGGDLITSSTSIPIPGDGITSTRFAMGTSNANTKTLHALFYRGAHDEVTRMRVIAALAAQYGVQL